MPRKQALKVFRTPIGFHDAYVAAPSQKAALEAWGTDTNLFASKAAEQVTDPELIKAPLARPGEVIKVARGTAAEHLAALAKEPKRKVRKAEKPTSREPRPSRDALKAAEFDLEALDRDRRAALAELDKEEQALARRRRETERRFAPRRRALEQKRDEARTDYERALERWRG